MDANEEARPVWVVPQPPGESKHKDVRYLDIRKDDELDEAQLTKWITQAASLPGWEP